MDKMRKAKALLRDTFIGGSGLDKYALSQNFFASVREMEYKHEPEEAEDEKELNKEELKKIFDDEWYKRMESNPE